MSLPLVVKDLRLHSPRGRLLLDLPALDAAPAALIGIRGVSGAGKTTLLYALAGLLDRAEGSVRWGETELLALTPEGRARFRAANIGMIFQDFMLFEELGALDNAALTALFRPRAEREALRTRAQARLAALGLTEMGRGVTSFSGGERQRVAIARAMAAEAPVLLADEPTASLDRGTADRLIDDLVQLVRTQGTTLIAVSHDAALLARMDRVLTISGGQLLADEGAACA
ncbi:ABC transporter ATP-binding protein [Salipiger sp. PrR007]|uniref:ABC transporter ATP-binding protein n=1 Tax=Salipiger sp. PrR007 TaxID=2706884 RepID=UPI0013BAC4CC|nr:ATP-binding cassette domain-containing protein [Salipiger sp. PrR007]NDW30650.1 ATP-binding cassette domain-containing protein [Salipiger sp. PrR007]